MSAFDVSVSDDNRGLPVRTPQVIAWQTDEERSELSVFRTLNLDFCLSHREALWKRTVDDIKAPIDSPPGRQALHMVPNRTIATQDRIISPVRLESVRCQNMRRIRRPSLSRCGTERR